MRGRALVVAALLTVAATPDPRFELDTDLGESAWPDEDAANAEIVEDIRRFVAEHPRDGRLVRDAHPKAHGCVRATFEVRSDLDPGLIAGVFQPGATFPAWVRFSNGNPDPHRADRKPDARGMAIKLMNVPGEKLSDERGTQDFVLIAHPTFFSADPRRYALLFDRGTSRNPLRKAAAPLALGPRGAAIAAKAGSKVIASPLEARYWSTVPFRLGTGPERRAVKYSAIPCQAGSEVPKHPEKDYLRRVLRETLADREACFTFAVQSRVGDMSVEDPRYEWPEAESPFVPVATLRVPPQTFDSPAQDAFCENLSFNPWHSLPEHRPLGGVNRTRRVVYEAISSFRRGQNGVPAVEPDGTERF
jgi:hypothetical protein